MTPDELKAARTELGISQAQLAARCEIHKTRISEYENGRQPITRRAALLLREGLRLAATDRGLRKPHLTSSPALA